MIDVLLYISICLILGGYVLYFLMIFIGRNKKIDGYNGFDITKDIISEYDSINVIENRGYFTIYNIKRKVIKLASNNYYGNDLSSLCLSLIEAGISIVDSKKNKFIDIFRVIFSNLKILYILPLIGIFISNSFFSVNDVIFGLFLMLCLSYVFYIILEIKEESCYFINNNIDKIDDTSKENKIMIINFIKKILLFDKMIYFGELVLIFRFVLIIFSILF